MKTSRFRSAPVRALILIFAGASLVGYVAMVSCSHSGAPAPTAPAANAVAPVNQQDAGAAANVESMESQIFGPATKSDVIRLPPAKKPAPNARPFYAPATKSGFMIKGPPEPPVAQPAAQQAPQQAQGAK